MDVWLIVSAPPHTLSPFTPIQGQHHTMSHIPIIKMSHIPTITIFPYYFNYHVQYSWFWKKNWTLQILQTDFTPCICE